MYDTTYLRQRQDDMQSRVDFIELLPGLLDNVCFLSRVSGEQCVQGNLDNLIIKANQYSLFVGGSLCKYYLGDNFQILDRKDTRRAIEKLSDTLHLPMNKAIITRVDVAANFIMRYPPSVYFGYLGDCGATTRLLQPNSVYYCQSNKTLAIYDKISEAKKHREPIPELYEGKNVLRYEYRAIKRLPKALQLPEVRAAMLGQRDVYNTLLNRWRDNYKTINKIPHINIDFSMYKGKKGLYRWALLAKIQDVGGQSEMIRQIREAQKIGHLTSKEAHDMKAAVLDVCGCDGVIAVESDLIRELDGKVAEAVKMYY